MGQVVPWVEDIHCVLKVNSLEEHGALLGPEVGKLCVHMYEAWHPSD